MAGTTNNTSDILLARLAEGLDSTAKMTQALLSDLRESEADFAAVKTELTILKDNVKGLSQLIKDGNGTSSILTRVALIEANIDTIKKWLDTHVECHKQNQSDFSALKDQLKEIDRRLSIVEEVIKEIKDQSEETERVTYASLNREIEKVHEKEKTKEKINSEKQSALVKIISAIIIGIVSMVIGYLAKSCNPTETSSLDNNNTTIRIL